MKKLLLVFAVLFATVSSSFAYQETIWVTGGYGSSNNSSSAIYVNSYVGSISLSASWNNSMTFDSSGMVTAYAYAYGGAPSPYSDQYNYYYNSPSYSKTVYFQGWNNQPYITSVNFSISATSCSGQATLTVN
jgi:hypothetical protein